MRARRLITIGPNLAMPREGELEIVDECQRCNNRHRALKRLRRATYITLLLLLLMGEVLIH